MQLPSFRILGPMAVIILVAGTSIYVARGKSAGKQELLNQFRQVTAPQNNTILTDDAVLRKYIAEYGPAPTMPVIIAAANNAGIDCHNRAHQFGRMTFEEFGDEALKLNLPECHSGYYHGAIEAYFKENGTSGLKAKLSTICPKELNVFYTHQCMHGLGHGLMAWSNYELPETLDFCALIDNPQGQGSCRTGAYMENIVGGLTSESPDARAEGHFTKYLSDDPQYPCTIVKDEYKADCYFLQTDRMLQLGGGNVQAIADGCAAAPDQYKYTCYASMGRTIGGLTRGHPDQTLASCMLAPQGERRNQCIDGAAKDTLWDKSGQQAGFSLCSIIPPEDGRETCYLAIISQAHSVLDTAQRAEFCAQVPQEFMAACTQAPY